ncbi:MAG: glucose-6-phosphate dehydrogenase [Deltaproteobacteria bacterium]|nr:glucose-6-phosphate dehydrogenase [Deltaproteobacteria bacterium]
MTLEVQSSPKTNAEPCAMIIFGASGDLTRRKLMPALYSLALQRRLPDGFCVIGSARSRMTDEMFRERMRAAASEFSPGGLRDERVWEDFARRLYYVSGAYEDPEAYQQLSEFMAKFEREHGTRGNRIFYLSTPPDLYGPIIRQMAAAGLAGRANRSEGWTRIVIEKPFGSDLETAKKLNREVHEVFDENQVYRIDHYLGKETVQNILVFRFGNAIFEPIWNRRYVDHVQVVAAETVGVENRGGYYEKAGVLRDMFQNHLFQLLCLTAMEAPVAFAADAVHQEKLKVLQAVCPISPEGVNDFAVRGQYGEGMIGGRQVKAYRQEPDARPDSRTETYAALKLFIDSWRWQGVPFYLRSGKRLAKKVTEVAIQFKQPPLLLFKACPVDKLGPNVLVLRIHPEEGISLRFEVKVPGDEVCVSSMSLDFSYQEAFGSDPADAYETLLIDCMRGDATLFTRHDWIELSWRILDPVLKYWAEKEPQGFPNYPAGSWGPPEADAMIGRDGLQWRRP